MIGGVASWRIMQKEGIVDLSHVIEHGMTTYPGLPGPQICDFWTRESSGSDYDDGSSFQIGRIDMVANTGTYLDSPFHRFADGADLADLPLRSLADLPGIVVRRPFENGLAQVRSHFHGLDVRGKAVLVHTGWDRHWRTAAYGANHPFLTRRCCGLAGRQWRGARRHRQQQYRRHAGSRAARPYPICSAANIPICEHLTGSDSFRTRAFASPPCRRGCAAWEASRCALMRCRLSHRRLEPFGDDCIGGNGIDARVNDSKPSSG